MKLAVMSDFHLGYSYNTERREDSFVQANEALQKATELNADAILIAGDIFDSRIPNQEVLGLAIQMFKRVADKKIPVFAIHGTHERRGKGLTNSVQLLEKAGLLKHLHCEHSVVDIKGQKLAVYGMSGVPEEFASIVLEKWHPEPVPGALNIMMLHQSIDPFLYTSDGKTSLKLTDLPQNFDLIVGGHMHWNEEREYGGGKFIIPGSTVLTQMRRIEVEKPKGFYIYENGSLNFVKLSTPRKFYFIAMPFENAAPQQVIDRIRAELSSIAESGKKPIVKIALHGTLGSGFSGDQIDLGAIERQFQNKIILRIDKDRFGSKEILERRDLIERLRQKQLSVDELGVEILKRHLEELNYGKLSSLEPLLNALFEGNYEEARRVLSV